MKKNIIIAALVAVLVGSLAGGAVLAAGRAAGQPVVMVSDGDGVYFAPGTGTSGIALTLAEPSTSGVVHVSLTVYVPAGSYFDNGDRVTALIYFPDKEGTTDGYRSIDFPAGEMTTVEFDAGTPPHYPYAWNLVAYNYGPSLYYMNVNYNYTMTYPKP